MFEKLLDVLFVESERPPFGGLRLLINWFFVETFHEEPADKPLLFSKKQGFIVCFFVHKGAML